MCVCINFVGYASLFLSSIGFSTLVHASVGEDVVLNCTIPTNLKFEEIEVKWRLLQEYILEQTSKHACLSSSYEGRAIILQEWFSKRNCSLKLSNVSKHDIGEYTYEMWSETKKNAFEGTVTLNVNGKYTWSC